MKPTETNITICGHAKHGKSTLAGRLLYEFGAVNERDLENLRREAEERNRQLGQRDFNEFSLMFLKRRSTTFTGKDGSQGSPSRTVFPERGTVTIEEGRVITLIDNPGHEKWIDNIVYGIYLADLAVLVVEASSGVEQGTKEVARILASLAIPVIAVFVTKMDIVGYSKLRFDDITADIKDSVLPIMRSYIEQEPPIIPISALSGAGFGKPSKELNWYKGSNALQVIKRAQTTYAPANIDKIRLSVEGSQEIYSPQGVGAVIVGALETGTISPGSQLILEPASKIVGEDLTVRTRSVQRARSVTEKKSDNSDSIPARAIVALAVSGQSIAELEYHFRKGGVLGTPDDPPAVAEEIAAQVIFFEANRFYSGKEYVVYTNASRGTARIIEIQDRSKVNDDLDNPAYSVHSGEYVTATLRFEQPLCIEASPEFQRLRRFILREHNTIVACGLCLRIIS